jgi:protoporphyrin/coproporphyrin ferrochelatase
VKKSAVLLVNFGGPRSIDEVPEFIRTLTGQELPAAGKQRAIERYRLIGGCSPLPVMAEEHARLLTAATGGNLDIRAAFKYSRPSIEERITECQSEKVERILFFIMTPFYTSRTVGSYITTAKASLSSFDYHPDVLFIHSWYKEPLFVECWTTRIRKEAPYPDAFYLFSAHSLPASLADEPYKSQIEETVKKIASELNLAHYGIGWQSIPANVTEAWIGPTVESLLDEASERQFRTVVQVPIGFLTDHMETLYDIDIVHKQYATAKGLNHCRVSCLNADPLFIETLRKILARSLQDAA